MNEAHQKHSHAQHQSSDFNIVDVLIVLARRKKLILTFPFLVAVVVAGITLALPNIYLANTRLLPPQQSQSAAGALLSQLGGIAGAVAGGTGLKSPSELYISMLKSRTVADRLIERFELKKAYDTTSQEKARRLLAESTEISAGKDGLITIQVEDQDQQRVALLANSYVDELARLTKTLAVTEAAQRRLFFERQLEISKNNLANAEAAMKNALDKNGVISVDAQSRAVVGTVSSLRAQISAKEIQIGSMRSFVTETNPDYLRAQSELRSLRAELNKLENGREVNSEKMVETEGKSEGLANIKILRDVKYHEMLYQLLSKQYEAARLDEAKDSSIIQVLDPATTPEQKFKPKRALIVVLSAFLAGVLAVIWALFSESKRRALALPEQAARWSELKRHLRAK